MKTPKPQQDHTIEHNAVCHAILDYLRMVARGFAWKTFGGSYEMSGRSDILACLDGRFIAVEVKTGKSGLAANQQVFRCGVEEAGGIFILAKKVEDVEVRLWQEGLIEKCYLVTAPQEEK